MSRVIREDSIDIRKIRTRVERAELEAAICAVVEARVQLDGLRRKRVANEESHEVMRALGMVHEALTDALEDVMQPMKCVKCAVASTNSNGDSDICYVAVECTQRQFDEGKHREAAIEYANDNDYHGPKVVFDEDDFAGRAIMEHACWPTMDVVDIDGEPVMGVVVE